MNVVPADTLSIAELAEHFTAGYEGYFVPIQVDEATMRYMVEAWDIDLRRSRVASGTSVVVQSRRARRALLDRRASASSRRAAPPASGGR